VSFEAFKVTLSPNPLTVTPAAVGTPYTRTFSVKNDFAAFSATQTVTPTLASVRTVNGSIADGGAQQTIPITVPAGLSALTVTLGGASDPGADLDIYVYDCTAGPTACVLRGSGTGSTANETVNVTTALNPGAWKAVIDPFAVPAGTTTFVYSDSFSKPAATAYGTLTTPASSATATPRGSGETWTFDITATATEAAGTGRFLRGAASVRLGAGGPVLGTAFVILETNP
jgi:hypothetical protein